MQQNSYYNYKKGINELKKASKSFPNGSGVYNEPLYVGKAKNLKKRISSYLDENRQTRRIKTLISLTDSLSFIKTPNEIDSLILENNLIKQLKPRFNIRLMDDKSFITKRGRPCVLRYFLKYENEEEYYRALCILFLPFRDEKKIHQMDMKTLYLENEVKIEENRSKYEKHKTMIDLIQNAEKEKDIEIDDDVLVCSRNVLSFVGEL